MSKAPSLCRSTMARIKIRRSCESKIRPCSNINAKTCGFCGCLQARLHVSRVCSVSKQNNKTFSKSSGCPWLILLFFLVMQKYTYMHHNIYEPLRQRKKTTAALATKIAPSNFKVSSIEYATASWQCKRAAEKAVVVLAR